MQNYNTTPSRRLSYSQPLPTLPGPDEENSESTSTQPPPTNQRQGIESPNTQRPDEIIPQPLSCSSTDLPDLQSGSSSDDGSILNKKDVNFLTVLREFSENAPVPENPHQQQAVPQADLAKAKTKAAPPKQDFCKQQAVPKDNIADENISASPLNEALLPPPAALVLTAEPPESAQCAQKKKKPKRQFFSRTTEADEDIYLQEASQRNKLTNQALHTLYVSHCLALNTLEMGNRLSLSDYLLQPI